MAKGQPLDEVMNLFWDTRLGMTLMRQAREVYQRDEVRTIPRVITPHLEQQDDVEESYFVYTLSPSHDAHGNVDSVIIYTLDKTEQRTHEMHEERTQLKLIFDNTPSALLALYDASNAHLLMASPNYLRILSRMAGTRSDKSLSDNWLDTTIVASSEQASALWDAVQESRAPIHLP